MAVSPTIQDEVAFIASVNDQGTLVSKSYYGWNQMTPAAYSSLWTAARKWGGSTAGSSGGTVSYYFDPASKWNATEQKWLAAGLALWAAVANIKFVETTNRSQAGIAFRRTNDGGSYTYAIYRPSYLADRTGGKVLGVIAASSINIDTTGTSFGPITGLASQGGFTIENLLHEEGHALGLGHAGPYNGAVNTATQQFSAYDNKAYTLMSYIDPGTAAKYSSQSLKGANWKGQQPTTWMPLDILAIQQLYGVAANTPLSGGQVFGFHTNIAGALRPFFDFTQNTKPVITIWDKGGNNTLDLSGFSGSATVDLNPGSYSSAGGLSKNIAIAYETQVNRLVCTAGGTSVTCNDYGDTVIGGAGNDTIRGGKGSDTLSGGNGNDIFYASSGTDWLNGGNGSDTAIFTGERSDYTIVNSGGTTRIKGNGIDTSLVSIETIQFDNTPIATGASKSNASNTSATTSSNPQIGWTAAVTQQTANMPLSNNGPLLRAGLIESIGLFQATTG